jgi:hypothetical protein
MIDIAKCKSINKAAGAMDVENIWPIRFTGYLLLPLFPC